MTDNYEIMKQFQEERKQQEKQGKREKILTNVFLLLLTPCLFMFFLILGLGKEK